MTFSKWKRSGISAKFVVGGFRRLRRYGSFGSGRIGAGVVEAGVEGGDDSGESDSMNLT